MFDIDADDVQAVLQDLFPGVEIPEHDYGRLQEEIENVIQARHLQVVADQVLKVIQLYETMIVRHGVMLVGPTGSGKTTVYQVQLSCCYVIQRVFDVMRLVYCMVCTHTKLARRAFSIAGPSTWNSLSADIQLCENILTFKCHLKLLVCAPYVLCTYFLTLPISCTYFTLGNCRDLNICKKIK